MEPLRENNKYYASPIQREVLLDLILYPDIEKSFFLTGGTALAVFYLNHRTFNDIDLFTIEPIELSEIDHWIRTSWPHENIKIKESPNFLSTLIKGIKVDLVIDSHSIREMREQITFEKGHSLSIDTLTNISSNKFCTLVSRTEPKDFVDFYFIAKKLPGYSIDKIYRNARAKDAIFDDPARQHFNWKKVLNLSKIISALCLSFRCRWIKMIF